MSSPNPASLAIAVTPSNSVNFPQGTCRALYVGSGGNISVLLDSGDSVTFANVQTGSVLPVECLRVNSTGTTAASLIALY